MEQFRPLASSSRGGAQRRRRAVTPRGRPVVLPPATPTQQSERQHANGSRGGMVQPSPPTSEKRKEQLQERYGNHRAKRAIDRLMVPDVEPAPLAVGGAVAQRPEDTAPLGTSESGGENLLWTQRLQDDGKELMRLREETARMKDEEMARLQEKNQRLEGDVSTALAAQIRMLENHIKDQDERASERAKEQAENAKEQDERAQATLRDMKAEIRERDKRAEMQLAQKEEQLAQKEEQLAPHKHTRTQPHLHPH